jgi:hypothetical protein
MGTISAIIAVLKALPILDSWFKGLVAAYTKWKIESNDRAFTEGMSTLIRDGDQRKLEEAAGIKPGPDENQTEIVKRPRRPH